MRGYVSIQARRELFSRDVQPGHASHIYQLVEFWDKSGVAPQLILVGFHLSKCQMTPPGRDHQLSFRVYNVAAGHAGKL